MSFQSKVFCIFIIRLVLYCTIALTIIGLVYAITTDVKEENSPPKSPKIEKVGYFTSNALNIHQFLQRKKG